MADDDPRLLHWCRMGLLAGALPHWFAAGILLWQKAGASLYTTPFSNLG
jgi:hypothetical protein